jgi:hypothetical protein
VARRPERPAVALVDTHPARPGTSRHRARRCSSPPRTRPAAAPSRTQGAARHERSLCRYDPQRWKPAVPSPAERGGLSTAVVVGATACLVLGLSTVLETESGSIAGLPVEASAARLLAAIVACPGRPGRPAAERPSALRLARDGCRAGSRTLRSKLMRVVSLPPELVTVQMSSVAQLRTIAKDERVPVLHHVDGRTHPLRRRNGRRQLRADAVRGERKRQQRLPTPPFPRILCPACSRRRRSDDRRRLAAAAVGLAVVCSVTAASGASLAVAGATAHGTADRSAVDVGRRRPRRPRRREDPQVPSRHDAAGAAGSAQQPAGLCTPRTCPRARWTARRQRQRQRQRNGKDARVAGCFCRGTAAGASDGVRDRQAPASELSDALVRRSPRTPMTAHRRPRCRPMSRAENARTRRRSASPHVVAVCGGLLASSVSD